MNRYMPAAMIIVAIVMSCTLMSDKVKINFTHSPKLETYINYKNFKIQDEDGTPSIYLSSTIEDPDSYRDLIMYIDSLKGGEANLYLAGNGGSVDSTIQLINAIKNSKAKFNVILYGNVYSGHAMLAVAVGNIKAQNDNLILLFHTPAVYKDGNAVDTTEICDDVTGTDRGHPAKDKCVSFVEMTKKQFESIILPHIIRVLTPEQIQLMLEGEDVKVFYKDIKGKI